MQENNEKNIEFKTVLNEYIDILQCTQKELADASGINTSIIGRYRNGKLIPKPNSIQIKRLIDGIVILAEKNNNDAINKENVTTNIYRVTNSNNIDFDLIKQNLNILIETLNLNIADVSRYLGYDPSYLSKIRNGVRKPNYINDFINSIIDYVIFNFKDESSKEKIISLIDKDEKDITNLNIELKNWFSTNNHNENFDNKIADFLKELNDFNLENYIKAINFNNLSIHNDNFDLPKSKTYIGTEEMRKAEIDFLKGTFLSNGNENIFMYSDISMEEMMRDVEFGKTWMLGIALNLKKGLHIDIIHNVNRPFNEMMAGLEAWIPLYMTGQITPYYFKNYNNKIFSTLNYVSCEYALIGECINGHHNKGRYYLTNNKLDIKYYREKSNLLLKKAHPLMNIYTNINKNDFDNFYKQDIKIKSNRKRILSQLPLHTLDIETLEQIAKRNKISSKQIIKLKEYLKLENEYINKITNENIITDEIYILSKSEFEKQDVFVDFKKYDTNIELKYTYDEYLKHVNKTKNYNHENYKLVINKKQIFNNIDIYVNENNYVIISKINNPNIHFVIRHEKLISAIENFIPPIIEENTL